MRKQSSGTSGDGETPNPRVTLQQCSQGGEVGGQAVQAGAVAGDAAEVAEGGGGAVEAELPGQLPVAGVGGSQLPAGLAAEQPHLLPQPTGALDAVHLRRDVTAGLPQPLRVQRGDGHADEEDDDLQEGSKARGEFNSSRPTLEAH